MDSNFLIISAGRVMQIAISLLSVRVFTSLLSAAEVGNLYLVNSIFGFFGLALLNPVGMFINRKLHTWSQEKNLLNRLFVFRIYLLALSLVSVPIVYCVHEFAGIGAGIPTNRLILYLVFTIYFYTWNQTILPALNMLNHRTSFVLFSTLTLVLGLLLSVVLVKTFEASAVLWLSGQVFSQMLITLLAFAYLKKILSDKLDFREIKKSISAGSFSVILAFTLPLGITTLFMWAQNQSYRLVIEKTVGLAFLGRIGLGMAIASSIASAAESILQQLYLPQYYREINTDDPVQRTKAWNRLAQATMPIYVSLTLLVSFLAPCLVTILANKKFSGAYMFVVYGAWIELFRMTVNTLSNVAHAEMKTKHLMKAYCLGGIAAVAGSYLAARQDNYQQLIPSVLVASGFLTVVAMYRDMKKLMPFKIGIRKIAASAALTAPIAGALFFYRQPLDLSGSLLIAASFGIYWLLVQYRSVMRARAAA
jgi:O-antigen/teichoic acid export membrane protein